MKQGSLGIHASSYVSHCKELAFELTPPFDSIIFIARETPITKYASPLMLGSDLYLLSVSAGHPRSGHAPWRRSKRLTLGLVIRIFGLYSHSQINKHLWSVVWKELSGRGNEYRKR